ncbi:MAG: DNA gyrase subunit A, partial [Planctomycetota bacterium]
SRPSFLEVHLVYVGLCVLGNSATLDAWKEELGKAIEDHPALRIARFRTTIDLRDGLLDEERVLFSQAQMATPTSDEYRKSAYLLGRAQTPVRGSSESWLYTLLVAGLRPDLARSPILAGNGNFGTLAAPPAAPRYTEFCTEKRLHLVDSRAEMRRGKRYPRVLEIDEDLTPSERETRLGRREEVHRLRDRLKLARRHAEALETQIESLEQSIQADESKEGHHEDAASSDRQGRVTKRAKKTSFDDLPPAVLFPHRLVNGSIGLEPEEGVIGISGCFPSHRLDAVAVALLAVANGEKPTDEKLLDLVGLPDFARGGTLLDPDAARESQRTGSGEFAVHATFEVYEREGNEVLAVRELPPATDTRTMVQELHAARKKGGLPEIESAEDWSGESLRVEFRLSPGSDPNEVRDSLLQHTSLGATFTVDMHGEDNEVPTRTNVPDLIRRLCTYQAEVFDSSDALIDALEHLGQYGDPARTKVRES